MTVKGLIERRLGPSGLLSTYIPKENISVRIKTKEDGVIWKGDLSIDNVRDRLLEVARLSQKTLYIHSEDNDKLIGKVHVQLSLFGED